MTATQKTKEDMIRRATLALRLLDGSIPDGTTGRIYRTAGGWLLDYGAGAEVDLHDLSGQEIFILVNETLAMPFAKLSSDKSEATDKIMFPGLPPVRETA